MERSNSPCVPVTFPQRSWTNSWNHDHQSGEVGHKAIGQACQVGQSGVVALVDDVGGQVLCQLRRVVTTNQALRHHKLLCETSVQLCKPEGRGGLSKSQLQRKDLQMFQTTVSRTTGTM